MKKTILAILVLAVFAGFAAGCGSDTKETDKKTGETTSPPAETATAADKEKPSQYVAGYLPDADYGGYEFRMVTPPNGLWNLLSLEADVEEETGDILYDAIYKRNRLIEERYNIVFKGVVLGGYDACMSSFQKSSQSGSDDFDLCMMIPQQAWPQALAGHVVPVAKLPYLDISQPWYIHAVNAQVSIGGKHFFAYSDECLNLLEISYCVLFNKKMVADLGLDNMYNLVKGDKWTMDKFFGYAKTATADLNGDGVMTDTDRYGIVGMSATVYPPLWQGTGISIIGKDSDDYHVFTGDDPKVYDVLEKIYANLCAGDKIYFDGYFDKSTAFGSRDNLQVAQNQFAAGHGLFYLDAVSLVPLLRAMETDFGILPMPKYDEAQKGYYTSAKGWINCVSVSAGDLGRTSLIMEALAVESKNNTVPAYMEVAIRTKHTRDEESLEMLDIIEKSRTLDLSFSLYGGVADKYSFAFVEKKGNFASFVEKNVGAIEKELDKANEMARALE